MPLAAHTCINCAAPAVCGKATPRGSGTSQRQAQILLVQTNPKAGVEGPLDHAFSMHFQNVRRGKAAHQRQAHLGQIGAGLAGKQQRFAYRRNVERHDDLVGDLAGLSITIAADQRDVFTHQLKQRFRCMVPESRDVILSTQEEKALWQTCFTAAPYHEYE